MERQGLGITVADALSLPALSRARPIAGHAGLGRWIRSVNMMEVPDIAPYLKPGELLLTTAFPIRHDAAALASLVPMLAERGLAALAIKPGRYVVPPQTMLSHADELAFPVIELAEDASFNDILADVLGSILNRQALQLERSQVIHEQLTAVVLAGGSFQELAETLSSLIGKPAAILDARANVLASTPPQGKTEGRLQTIRPVRVGSTRHGEVVVRSEEPLPPESLVAMDHSATIAALLITQARAVLSREQRYRVALLHELVSGRPLNIDEMLSRAAAFGWNLGVPRAAILVGLTRHGSEVRVAGQPLEEQVLSAARSAAGASAIAWALPSGLEVLAESPDAAHKIRIELELQRGLTASVGVGAPRHADELHLSHRQAFEALELGLELQGAGFVMAHDQLGFFRLLHQLPSSQLEDYCQEMLKPLLEYDREHEGSLVRTLEVFLHNGRNRVATARQLFVHYNTLRYRLEQIERMTGGLDRHSASRLSIELALHARRLLTARLPRSD